MKNRKFAVVTGDLVDSTTINANYRQILQAIASDIEQHIAPGSLFEIFRGDSFQMLIPQPDQALTIGLLLRIGMRRHSNGSSLEDTWDARVSIGIGGINEAQLPSSPRLGLLDGEAFVRSGRALDSMKADGDLLKITTGDDSLDEPLRVCSSLADAIISRWTTPQSEALYLHLLQSLTQKEIGKRLKVSQRAIGQRLESAQFHKMQPFLKYFKKIV